MVIIAVVIIFVVNGTYFENNKELAENFNKKKESKDISTHQSLIDNNAKTLESAFRMIAENAVFSIMDLEEHKDDDINSQEANTDEGLTGNNLEDDLKDISEETEDTNKLETPKTVPNLMGMDEATAINTCTQNGYKYSIEYYLGGDGTVVSQSPTSSENAEEGGNIIINIGISQSDFSNRLLELINDKRRASGLGDLSFSDQLNFACSILAQENVNSVDCIRPDGNHWSSVLWNNGIWMNDAIFTSRNNITSLSDANGRIKYTGNSYGAGNLLTASYTLIGMAYTSNNSLLIIVGN